jgi:putative transposase
LHVTDAAAATTGKARRDRERRSATPARLRLPQTTPQPPPPQTGADIDAVASPFEVIEQW